MKPTIRVLIVEDRKDHQKIFKEIVESIGYLPEIATSVEESEALLARMSFHVAMVDLSLDDNDPFNRDGFKVLEQIKAIDEGTRAIVLTAFGDVEDADETFTKYNLFSFIRKDRMDIAKVKEKIITAADQSQEIRFHSTKQLIDVVEFIKGNAIQQLLKEGKGTSEELELFLRRLLKEMRPLLLDKRDAKLEQLEGKKPTVHARFWSKSLGEPIEAWFGNFDEMQDAIQNMNQYPQIIQKAGYKEKVMEVFDPFSFPNFRGAVYTLFNVTFGEFEAQFPKTNS